MSKGSNPRPYSVPPEEFAAKYEGIFGPRPKKERYMPPPLPTKKEKAA